MYQERNFRQEAERRIIYLQNEITEMRHERARMHSPIMEPPNIEQRLSVSGGQTGRQSNRPAIPSTSFTSEPRTSAPRIDENLGFRFLQAALFPARSFADAAFELVC